MAERFQNKYRIPSARLETWDYSCSASYFVTICTQNRMHYFGDIVNDEMHLSEIGKMVQAEWLKTPEMRPAMDLELGPFVVMPNHFHAIITIGENNFNAQNTVSSDHHRTDAAPASPIPPNNVPMSANSDAGPKPVPLLAPEYKNTFGKQAQNLASVIRGFKAAVTGQARKLHADFAWLARYHDHIIRGHKSYKHIEDYIRNNPFTWRDDKFFEQ